MRFLLDTHVFIWSFQNTNKLSRRAVRALTDPTNRLFISVATIWEMQVKVALEKLDLDDSVENIIEEQIANGFDVLDIKKLHALNVGNLPTPHKDPFDRMIISQAIVEDMTVITVDPMFPSYPVKVLW